MANQQNRPECHTHHVELIRANDIEDAKSYAIQRAHDLFDQSGIVVKFIDGSEVAAQEKQAQIAFDISVNIKRDEFFIFLLYYQSDSVEAVHYLTNALCSIYDHFHETIGFEATFCVNMQDKNKSNFLFDFEEIVWFDPDSDDDEDNYTSQVMQ